MSTTNEKKNDNHRVPLANRNELITSWTVTVRPRGSHRSYHLLPFIPLIAIHSNPCCLYTPAVHSPSDYYSLPLFGFPLPVHTPYFCSYANFSYIHRPFTSSPLQLMNPATPNIFPLTASFSPLVFRTPSLFLLFLYLIRIHTCSYQAASLSKISLILRFSANRFFPPPVLITTTHAFPLSFSFSPSLTTPLPPYLPHPTPPSLSLSLANISPTATTAEQPPPPPSLSL